MWQLNSGFVPSGARGQQKRQTAILPRRRLVHESRSFSNQNPTIADISTSTVHRQSHAAVTLSERRGDGNGSKHHRRSTGYWAFGLEIIDDYWPTLPHEWADHNIITALLKSSTFSGQSQFGRCHFAEVSNAESYLASKLTPPE